MKKNSSLLLLIIPIALLLFDACRKQDLISNDSALKLTFSTDSVVFDTVFTSIGTSTRRLMIYNTSNKRLNISSIQVGENGGSVFRLNVDGTPGLAFENIEIAANDSLFVFVRATIDPLNVDNPFVVEDDLVFLINGNIQKVKLIAWGQDANYIIADQIVKKFPKFKIVADSLQTVHWTAGKPYVVYGYALIDSYGELIIDEGARVYFHDKSGLWAFSDGVLKVRGTLENPVIFQGDRLEQEYRDIPGQWDRIWLMDGRQGFDHEIDYAIIRNGFIGIQAESFLKATANNLILRNTIIENQTGMGIFTRLFAIDASNLVVANCGNYSMALSIGGDYRFMHTTVANNWSLSTRNNPSILLNNYTFDSLDVAIPVPFNLVMGNSIIYGSNSEEIETDFVGGADSTYLFDHCLVKTERKLSSFPGFADCFKNQDPLFKDYEAFDYHPDTLSPVIGKGKIDYSNIVPNDLDGVSRLPLPDLGAYQFVPKIN
ncbi:MAG: hypothetical protein HOO86_17160 [Bacteroidales bacterium]|nr:hypothetical protein [Bacteroidales bacterium]